MFKKNLNATTLARKLGVKHKVATAFRLPLFSKLIPVMPQGQQLSSSSEPEVSVGFSGSGLTG